VLVQIAFIVFAMAAVLSLVVDVGFTRITQGQMQNAADAAALEGIRKRDIGVLNRVTGQTVNDAFASDCLRRAAANRVVHWVFDDDMDQTNGDPDQQFGAGPIIDLTDGATSLHALQTTSVPDSHVYKPDLQLNQQNQVHGDMVSGRFCYTADPVRSEDASYELQDVVCTEPQHGSGAYARNDFNPNPTAPQPPPGLAECPAPDQAPPDPWPLPGSGSLAGVNDSAFLVRLRRSNEFQDLAEQTEPSVGSSGPSLPLVFGKGTTIHGDDPSSPYSVRRDGLTVRATAIAAVRPALHVGLPQPGTNQPGVTPFALLDRFAPTPNVAGTQATINPATGLICSGLTCVGANPANGVGRFVDNLTDPSRIGWTAISTVGQVLPAPVPVACALANAFAGYAPVYSPMASGTNRIIGFARIVLRPDPARPVNPCAKVISRSVSLVAPSNATANVAGGLPLTAAAQPADVRELLDKNLVRNGGVNYAPVLVPVLVR
jgi:putative Flp pilus-assembly TadE/G-like protein